MLYRVGVAVQPEFLIFIECFGMKCKTPKGENFTSTAARVEYAVREKHDDIKLSNRGKGLSFEGRRPSATCIIRAGVFAGTERELKLAVATVYSPEPV